ncbi:Crp/Fnr family transcriptional regulator [Olivibacter sp. SDN3]|uniref:Crp/Fnr family transcriptional regulator n=1 Tax=Olivibacter sp. SDN3 TaxID=2764720 RepID=UPI00165198A4|nr:Crp/Fnr family transcriptional regulator [Olivibacter sp. SDN3]QNL51925.1 Crp/Fnr family transcriptional regulator [Olivibacter sp. SDN3]
MSEWIQHIPFTKHFNEETISLGNNVIQNTIHSKGSFLLKNGQICGKLYFMVRGLVYAHTEQEQILWYEREGSSFTDLESFYDQKPSNHYFKVAENNTHLISINFNDLQHLFSESHQWALWGVRFYQHELQRIASYYEALRTKDASERYFKLIAAYPDILQRVPLSHIASYLGISQVSLSRIRAGVQKQ